MAKADPGRSSVYRRDGDEIAAWPGLRLERRIDEGNRNEVWEGRLGVERVAIRRSRRPPASLTWELDVVETLANRGFTVPIPVRSASGERSINGVVVQRWIDGEPPTTAAHWQLVAAELQRLHDAADDIGQRPGCLCATELERQSRSVDADMGQLPEEVAALLMSTFAEFNGVAASLIHGDPNASNIRITDEGRVGLLDWDESRVDLVWHDLSNLGVPILDENDHRRALRLSDAWETANAWVAEPDYAVRRLAQLQRANPNRIEDT